MSSRALHDWLTTRQRALDELEAAHRAVAGPGPRRRRATEQINHAYAVLVSSQFQGFCRDLHTEVAQSFVLHLPHNVQDIVRAHLVEHRQLDRGNPNPGNLGSDFRRFGVAFWPEVEARDRRNRTRQQALSEVAVWRNAIAHQDFSGLSLRARPLRVADVRRWRSACAGLAREFDAVLAIHLANLVGVIPW